MKFDARRHNPHPVLAPTNDDYPDGTLAVHLSDVTLADNQVHFNIRYECSEPAINDRVQNGEAVCKAMLYCRGTFFRQDIQAPAQSFIIQASFPVERLMGTVEVHPFIVSAESMELDPTPLNSEYRQQRALLTVDASGPLAAAHRMEFDIAAQDQRFDSLVVFESDESNPYAPGHYDIRLEASAKQIAIVVNESDYDQLTRLRNERTMALSSIYTAALVAAFAFIERGEEESELDDAAPNGWVECLKARRPAGGKSLSPFRLAQNVFQQPFGVLAASI